MLLILPSGRCGIESAVTFCRPLPSSGGASGVLRPGCTSDLGIGKRKICARFFTKLVQVEHQIAKLIESFIPTIKILVEFNICVNGCPVKYYWKSISWQGC
jgi:hypothetical protein